MTFSAADAADVGCHCKLLALLLGLKDHLLLAASEDSDPSALPDGIA